MNKFTIPFTKGKRAGFLAIMAFWYLALGVSNIIGPTTPNRQNGFSWLPPWMDSNELGWVWIVAAAISACGALKGTQCKRLENVAFASLMIPPLIWTCSYIIATILGHHPTGWIPALTFYAYPAVVMHIASWPEIEVKREP